MFVNRKVVISAAGGPENVVWQEAATSSPKEREVLVRVELAGAAFGDILLRRGVTGDRFPVTPGYDFIGVVEALGHGASRFEVGARVAGFPGHSAQQEYICLSEDDLVPVPVGVAPHKAVSAILNYLTAYQLLTRATSLRAGDKAFIYGLAGGLGGAMRQIAGHLGIQIFGTASKARLLKAGHGATVFDRNDPEWVQLARQACPHGFDAVFDPIGGASLNRSYGLLNTNGTLVMLGTASSVQGKRDPRLGVLGTLARFAWLKLRPSSRRARIFMVEGAKRDPDRFQMEMSTIFWWLSEGKIDPEIHAVLPLREARTAHEMLERGEVTGKIVLDARQ
jgi:NADPH:quinone reductase-like Zn-dependent oxidoreductase